MAISVVGVDLAKSLSQLSIADGEAPQTTPNSGRRSSDWQTKLENELAEQ